MTRDVGNIVADNRRRITRTSGRFVEVDEDRRRELSFGLSLVVVGVKISSMQTRPTGSQVVFGHGDERKGFDRGTFGDDKGEWVDNGTPDGIENDLTPFGRRIIARSLAGEEESVFAIGYEVDGDVDTKQITRRETVDNAARYLSSVISSVGFIEDAPFEVIAIDGETVASVESEAKSTDPTDEVRFEFELSFSGSAIGSSFFTDPGLNKFAESITDADSNTPVADWVVGETSDSISTGDGSLSSPLFTFPTDPDFDNQSVRYEGGIDKDDEPVANPPVDIGEIGLQSEDGTLVWATPMSTVTFQDESSFTATTTFRVTK